MGQIIQWPLDAFYWCRRGIAWLLAYCSLRAYGLEVSAKNVWHGTYSKRQHVDRNLEKAGDPPGLLATAKECLRNAQDRRSVVTDKCKTLLTVSSLLLALIGLFLPKSFAFDATWMRNIFFVAVAALLNTVTLLLVFFDVGKETEISLDQTDVELSSDDVKKNLINLHLKCQTDMENRTDYLVDLYKSARFFFLSAFTIVVLLFSVNFFSQSPTDETERIIERLRGEPKLIELLRGPKGEKGDKGGKGDRGEIGDTGAKGDRGEKGAVDTDRVIQQLLSDPRLKKLIEDSTNKTQAE